MAIIPGACKNDQYDFCSMVTMTSNSLPWSTLQGVELKFKVSFAVRCTIHSFNSLIGKASETIPGEHEEREAPDKRVELLLLYA